ncbi:MOSC domain-containing protein [Longispora sp. K20-0274]|uniref:MOSC domain-containing protein n=1 Tax=Longispora sp. K20-0274 TaxID=3088255 RepID=UPI00399A7527
MTGTITGIHRYPVKSMLGEDLSAGEFTGRGLAGDRVYAATAGDVVASAKHPRKWGPLLGCRGTTVDGRTRVRLPDGAELDAGSAELDVRLSALLGRPVRLSGTPPEEPVLERAVPEVEDRPGHAVVDATGTAITSGRTAAGTFFDFGPVHLVTTASLRGIGQPDGAARFRPNLVADVDGPGFPEDDWVGRTLRIGPARFEVIVPTPRCVVPTLAHGDLPADPSVLRTVAREHRVQVLSLGRLACVGVYLRVVEPGVVRLGDTVVVG